MNNMDGMVALRLEDIKETAKQVQKYFEEKRNKVLKMQLVK